MDAHRVHAEAISFEEIPILHLSIPFLIPQVAVPKGAVMDFSKITMQSSSFSFILQWQQYKAAGLYSTHTWSLSLDITAEILYIDSNLGQQYGDILHV